jgi:hypothetical protein
MTYGPQTASNPGQAAGPVPWVVASTFSTFFTVIFICAPPFADFLGAATPHHM